jgi:RNA recognition motif-containing protein
MKIYVGNLAYAVTDDQLRSLFEEFGEVSSARVIIDKITGKAKGFGFVEIFSDDAARKAIERLNGSQYEGRTLVVNEARPREDRPMPSNRMPRRNMNNRY